MSSTLIIAKIAGIVVSIITVLLGIAVIRALILYNPPVSNYCSTDESDYFADKAGATKRLSEALRFKTISYTVQNYERGAISQFASYIFKTFPIVHSSKIVSHEIINNLSLLYYVQGSNRNLKPYLLAAHMDVVPVEETKWSVSPFKGIIKDGFIWGRGAMDCKHLIMGILEALEFLLKKGYQPERSFYVAFGHDEEVNGIDGAQFISQWLQSRNIKLEYILDEGSFIVDNFIPGIRGPVAFVGISEKGSLNLKLSVSGIPGHSSMPNKETAIVILAKALSKLEGDVFPSMFGKGPEKAMLEEMAYAAAFPLKVIFTNIWLFKPFIIRYMSSPIMNAFHRTTTAVTLINGGTKINVLPSYASAEVNFRIHPAQTVEEVKDYVKRIINDDRVEITVVSSFNAHPVSPIDSFGYKTIKNTIRQIYNDSSVLPCTLIANTDTRWYLNLTDSIYRFSLVRIILSDLKRPHGHDERISINNYVELVNFFVHLIKNSDKSVIPKHIHTDL